MNLALQVFVSETVSLSMSKSGISVNMTNTCTA